MTNINAVSVPRNQNTALNSIGFHLSNGIENVIEKIENLRLTRDTIDQSNEIRGSDAYRTKHSIRRVSGCQTSNNNDIYDCDRDHDRENDRNDLIERGPIKSQFCSLTRSQPYCTSVEQPRNFQANETFLIDYDKTAEQILRDKECSEKLNACLDQLQDLERTSCTYDSNARDEDKSQVYSLRKDFSSTPSTIVGNALSDDLLLLENVLCGAFQAAQHVTKKSFLRSQETMEAFFDTCLTDGNTIVSSSESRESSRTHSPALPISTQSSGRSQPKTNHSPISSPRTTVTSTCRPAQIFSCSSSCSPSSSSQSYGDTSSPNSSFTYQTTAGSRIEERFKQDFENFQFWRPDGDTVVSNTVVNNIDDNELWSQVMDELVNNLNGEKGKMEETYLQDPSKVENATNTITFQTNNLQQVRHSSNRDNIPNEGVTVAKPVSWSDVSYTPVSRANIPQKDTQKIETTDNAINCYKLVPSYTKYDKSYGTLAKQHPAKTISTKDDIHHDRDFSPLFHSFGDSSTAVDATVATNFSFDDFTTKSLPTSPKDDYQIPKMVASFEDHSQQRCFTNSDRNTIPWSSLNLPSVKASEKLKDKLDPQEVKKAMISLLKRPAKELAKQDKDGDTKLMCLVGNPNELVQKMAYLVPLVERMSTITGALTIMNNRGDDALYLAALNCPQFPFVAGYLAATMLEKGIDFSQRLYHTRGDTLIHSIAAQGDSHEETLAELLALRTIQGNRLFDLSKRNYDGRTALHIAIESHIPFTKGITSLETIKLLLKYGADPRIKETKYGDNALHMAVSLDCDPVLVKLLLDTWASDLVNAVNYNHDTALHAVAAMSTNVSFDRQKEVCWLLVQAGGHTNLPNHEGKTPLDLVSTDRKGAIREIFHKRS
ncbi:uncharacterized protein LOC100648197 [Bombus terrestris]|uniref:Uncharacterized protein LOC100648197 n=1 Tax=Bombus terrestris TaxID=30195 RepID=A0A9B2JPS5_BOMTE|nr:uncharacterized protein LOC100648197 [Bombus terrestris]XP_012168871.2 uncharacterized protein LOC100648197 [Bombus terrestris]XP_012168878.2 uncharacterized protein LOC100648197 [Bombus terrestris]XP_048264832.1 uncharacterized protein LOC100648197 [Bombus terrestris]XP_048264833.1 uncharacterized protein LOC100648197 [Bombus terrestris]XP_048264840.1 uncharacterized protein LOC100648197 [Bombus terrestris]